MIETTDAIGDFLDANHCRSQVIGHIIERFVTRAGDPHLWGPRPNMHLLRGIVAHTGLDLEEFEAEDVVGYIWTTYIAPMRNNLCRLWDGRVDTCPTCGGPTSPVFSFMSSGEDHYEEVCPECQPSTKRRLST